MEKKKFSIELPKGGMSDLTKQVRNSPMDEFKNVSEHGECVWLFKDVKREIERIKFESDAKLNIRQLVNAMLLAFIKEHGKDLKNIRFG